MTGLITPDLRAIAFPVALGNHPGQRLSMILGREIPTAPLSDFTSGVVRLGSSYRIAIVRKLGPPPFLVGPRLRNGSNQLFHCGLSLFFFEKNGITTPCWVPFLRAFPVPPATQPYDHATRGQASPLAGHVKFRRPPNKFTRGISALRGLNGSPPRAPFRLPTATRNGHRPICHRTREAWHPIAK